MLCRIMVLSDATCCYAVDEFCCCCLEQHVSNWPIVPLVTFSQPPPPPPSGCLAAINPALVHKSAATVLTERQESGNSETYWRKAVCVTSHERAWKCVFSHQLGFRESRNRKSIFRMRGVNDQRSSKAGRFCCEVNVRRVELVFCPTASVDNSDTSSLFTGSSVQSA